MDNSAIQEWSNLQTVLKKNKTKDGRRTKKLFAFVADRSKTQNKCPPKSLSIYYVNANLINISCLFEVFYNLYEPIFRAKNVWKREGKEWKFLL